MFHKRSICVFLAGLPAFLAVATLPVECHTKTSTDSLRFFAIGDWGGQIPSPYYTKVEKAVANEMGKLAETLEPEFILALGKTNDKL